MELVSNLFEGKESSLFNTYTEAVREDRKIGAPKINSERQELTDYFWNRVFDKKGKKYRAAFINMKLAHLSVPDLYYLKSVCNNAKNFQKMFWWSLKPHNVDED